MEYIKDQEQLHNFFTKEYYQSINYTDYTLREQKYEATALDILKSVKVSQEDALLDYGCALGFLLKGYRKAGIVNTYGFDISDWALEQTRKDNLNTSSDISIISQREYKLTTVLDVFEHMFDEEVNTVLTQLTTDRLAVRIPVKLEGEDDFHLEVSRKDASHVNCKTEADWIEFINRHGYTFDSYLNTESIYSSPGCFCGIFKKN